MFRNVLSQTQSRNLTTGKIETATKTAGCVLHSLKTTTGDGYKLTLHRLGQKAEKLHHMTPILLQHGLWSSSENWLVQGPNQSLGYILKSAGFDVWLGNTRGSAYSREHTKFGPEQKEFWDFSWHEMGIFDLPATIDMILKETGKEQVYFIGHSQGTTAFFVMASELPQYNEKVRAMFALAPIAYLNNLNNTILQAASFVCNPLLLVFQALGIHKMFPHEDFISRLDKWWKENPTLPNAIAKLMITGVSNFPNETVTNKMRDVLLSHMHIGAASKGVAHYGQTIRKGFRKFDYGPEKNKALYGTEDPPEYDLSKITVPIVAFYSEGDYLTNYDDITKFIKKLGGESMLERVNDSRFNHQDFIWADLAKFEVLYTLFQYLFYYGRIL